MIKFLDLYKINSRFQFEFQQKFKQVLDSGYFIKGNEVVSFETNFAAFCGTKYCIGVANGLDALTIIFTSYIQLGKLQKGDKVIVPANTYIASILSIINAGLQPVLIEPNPKTFNLDVEEILKHLSTDVKAILAVHLYGQLAEMDAINDIAKRYGLLVVEDAAQAHGAIDSHNNLRAGNLSHAAAFSFYPAKNLGALGDAGAITTNDEELSNYIKMYHNYGSKNKYVNEVVGINSRLDEVQAAFLNIKLRYLDDDNKTRREVANLYLNGIKNPKIQLPYYDGSKNHVFHLFVIRVEHRSDFTEYLDANAIQYILHYPIAPHKQDALKSRFQNQNLFVTEAIHNSVVSLPISPVMTDENINTVIAVLNKY